MPRWFETGQGVLAPYQVPGPWRHFIGLVETLVWTNQIPFSSPHLCLFFSISHFPTNWKSASIIILKKSNKANYSHPSNFTPISILNALSKLLEKIILVKLKRLASANNWFSPNQHGFRSGFSTETATLSLSSLIENNRKNKVITCCMFLDIKSAFAQLCLLASDLVLLFLLFVLLTLHSELFRDSEWFI
jgi:hypothetical protein